MGIRYLRTSITSHCKERGLVHVRILCQFGSEHSVDLFDGLVSKRVPIEAVSHDVNDGPEENKQANVLVECDRLVDWQEVIKPSSTKPFVVWIDQIFKKKKKG